MADLNVLSLGMAGVNVDKDPLELDDNELVQAQNAINDPSAGRSALRKRPGLTAFTVSTTTGTVLGGISLPIVDSSTLGLRTMFIGRGPLT